MYNVNFCRNKPAFCYPTTTAKNIYVYKNENRKAKTAMAHTSWTDIYEWNIHGGMRGLAHVSARENTMEQLHVFIGR